MFYVFLAISLLFVGSLILKNLSTLRQAQGKKRPICALCVAVALTWIFLLVLYKADRFHDLALLGLLMGSSVTGLYYFVQKRVPKVLRIFSLPFFLSLTAVFYLLITNDFIWPVFVLLTVLWATAWLIFSWRSDLAKARIAKATMECCEDDK